MHHLQMHTQKAPFTHVYEAAPINTSTHGRPRLHMHTQQAPTTHAHTAGPDYTCTHSRPRFHMHTQQAPITHAHTAGPDYTCTYSRPCRHMHMQRVPLCTYSRCVCMHTHYHALFTHTAGPGVHTFTIAGFHFVFTHSAGPVWRLHMCMQKVLFTQIPQIFV